MQEFEKVYEETHEKTGITFTLEVAEETDFSPVGQFEDPAEVNEILNELASGNVWAWAQVRVTARIGDIVGDPVYLGGINFNSMAQFIASTEWDTLKFEARDKILERNKAAITSLYTAFWCLEHVFVALDNNHRHAAQNSTALAAYHLAEGMKMLGHIQPTYTTAYKRGAELVTKD